jgi:hypothetical protein
MSTTRGSTTRTVLPIPGNSRVWPDCWGLTASDDPDGYAAHAPAPVRQRHDLTDRGAVEHAVCARRSRLRALRHFLTLHGDKVWGKYGFVDAFCEQRDWYANTFLAIDQGPIVVMIENQRTGLLWKLFMSVPEVQTGCARLGFSSPWLTGAEHR